MSVYFYLGLGLFWILSCLGLGLYISGIGLSHEQQLKYGFRTMLITYLLGVFLLLTIVSHL